MNHKHLIILLLLLTATVVVSGCVQKPTRRDYIPQNTNTSPTAALTPTPTPTPSPSPTDTPVEVITSNIDTSNWLTYRNEKYGFEVKYPEGWYSGTGSLNYGNPSIHISPSRLGSNNDFGIYLSISDKNESETYEAAVYQLVQKKL